MIDFTEFINLGADTLANEGIMQICLTVYCGLLIILCSFMCKRASTKLIHIRRRDVDIPQPELDTYSQTGYYILKICKFQLFTMIMLSTFNMALLNMPELDQGP